MFVVGKYVLRLLVQRLLNTLQSNPDDLKQKLSETSRKVSLLRVNEKTLIRRHKGNISSFSSSVKNENFSGLGCLFENNNNHWQLFCSFGSIRRFTYS